MLRIGAAGKPEQSQVAELDICTLELYVIAKPSSQNPE